MSTSSRSYFPLALAGLAAIASAAVLFAPQVLGDGDTYWHLAVGAWIIAQERIPSGDVFSYTMAGHPWIAQEWLSEVVMAAAYRVAGWSGLVILFAAATGATVILLGRHLRQWLDPMPALLAVLIGMSLVSPSLLARPHVLAMPVMVIWCAALVTARERGRAPSFWLLPLMALWTNLHGSFPAGLAFAWLLTFEAMAAQKQAARWLGFSLAAMASTLLNPYGVSGALFPFRLIDSGALAGIVEWRGADLGQDPPLAAVLAVILYLGLVRGFRLDLPRFAIFTGLIYASLLHVRNQMLIGIMGLPAIAPALGRFFGSQPAPGRPEGWRTAATFAVAFCVLSASRLAYPLVRVDDWVTPQTALSHVPMSLRQTPVFNDDALGGYLIFVGIKPFIDGRADLYGTEFNAVYYRSMTQPGALFADQLARYGIKWAIVSARSPAVAAFSSLANWQCRYLGQTAAVYVLRGSPAPP